MIGPELKDFLEQGLARHIGVRDAMLQPEGARVVAARIADDGVHMLVYVAAVAAARLLPHLYANGLAAVTSVRATDDRACQVKGTFTDVRPATEDERELVERQWDAFMAQMEQIGIPRATSSGWTIWPAVAIRIKITAVFDQTPGSKAGTPIA